MAILGSISLQKLISVDGGVTFASAPTPPGVNLVSPTNPVYMFQIANTGGVALTNVTLVDTALGPIALPTTTLAPGASTQVPVTGTFALGEHCNAATVTGTFGGTQTVTDASTACFFGLAGPAIQVQKLVSVDGGLTFVAAETPPGPNLVAPTNPVYQFTVTNTGGVTLTLVSLSDTDLGAIVIGGTLDPGDSITVTESGTFMGGEHCNTATATGTFGAQTVTDTSTACYFGVGPSILLTKEVSVNGGVSFVDANTPPGPTLVSPTNPQFRFTVTNTGNITLSSVTVLDTGLGPIVLPTTTLTPGQSTSTIVTGTFAFGQHCNVATATGTANGVSVTDSDAACYFGSLSAVPVFPDISGPAPQDQIIDRLLETVALEELALAALINAEAEKVQAVAAAGVTGPVDPEDLKAVNRSVAEVIRQAGKKEEHLRRKLQRILAHKESNG